MTVVPEIDKAVLKQMDNCQFTLTMHQSLCDGNEGNCEDQEVPEGRYHIFS